MIVSSYFPIPFASLHLASTVLPQIKATHPFASTTLPLLLIFFRMITTHQYQLGKGVATAILSILGILIILFVAILVFFLISQVFGFVGQLSTEISYSLNE